MSQQATPTDLEQVISELRDRVATLEASIPEATRKEIAKQKQPGGLLYN